MNKKVVGGEVSRQKVGDREFLRGKAPRRPRQRRVGPIDRNTKSETQRKLSRPRYEFFSRTKRTSVSRSKAGLDTLSTRELFEFVVDDAPDAPISDSEIDDALQKLLDKRSATAALLTSYEDEQEADAIKKADDAVFMGAFLPRSLHELGATAGAEKAQRQLATGERESGYMTAVAGLLGPADAAQPGDARAAAELARDEAETDESGDEDEYCESEEEELTALGRLPNDPADRAAVKAMKRAATKAAKEVKTERRKTKMKKHLKKKSVKNHAAK